jgi:hypothetical protein
MLITLVLIAARCVCPIAQAPVGRPVVSHGSADQHRDGPVQTAAVLDINRLWLMAFRDRAQKAQKSTTASLAGNSGDGGVQTSTHDCSLLLLPSAIDKRNTEQEIRMSINTLLIIIVVVLLLGGGGFYFR